VGGVSNYFELKDFSVEIDSKTKDLLILIGRSHVVLKRYSKDISFPNPEQAQKLLEQEEKLKDILRFQACTDAVKRIRFLLKHGAIPRSDLPEFFAEKRSSKEKYRHQHSIEVENVLEFVLSNLPPDFEEAKENAKRQNQEVIERRREGEREYAEKKQRQKEERQKELAEKKKC